jgi:glucokinase
MAGNKVIAVDLGGTNLRVALMEGSKILKYKKFQTPKTKKELLNVLVNSISEIFNKDVRGIGMGSPGPLKNGVILNPPNIPLKNFNLKKFLQDKFKIRVEIENDAKCVARSELIYGCKKKNFFILTLGTGVGGGVIIDSKLYTGVDYGAELGQIIINNGRTFENYWQDYRKSSEKIFGRVIPIMELIDMKDQRAKKILKDVTMYLGQGISSLIHVLDPEVVVLMGGAREAGSKFLNMIKERAYHYSLFPKKTPIEWSKIEHPGLLGASLLVK